jgi:DNA replication protein DnaC
MNHPNLHQSLQKLRLSGLATTLDLRLQEARGNNLTHEEFLELLLQDELNVRHQRMISRRSKAAAFREKRTLDSFDFSFNPSINRAQIYQLATGRFCENAEDVLFIGPPGVGKSHLAQAIGYELIKSGKSVLYRSIFDLLEDLRNDSYEGTHQRTMGRYLKCDLLIIDDMGIKQLPPKSGEYLFEIIMRRYELRSTLMTSNRPLEEWGKLIGDVPAATAILDRFLHHANLIKIKGRSYRLQNRIDNPGDEDGGAHCRPPSIVG